MDRDRYADDSYAHPHVPPATSPMIDRKASARDAAELAGETGDSDFSGAQESGVDRHGEDADIPAGDTPDEVLPDKGDVIAPDRPAEIDIERGGDTDNPGKTPAEAPAETLLPPD